MKCVLEGTGTISYYHKKNAYAIGENFHVYSYVPIAYNWQYLREGNFHFEEQNIGRGSINLILDFT